jgi:hypothetical protein
VLRRSEETCFSSPSDDEVGGPDGAIRAERAQRAEQSNTAVLTAAPVLSHSSHRLGTSVSTAEGVRRQPPSGWHGVVSGNPHVADVSHVCGPGADQLNWCFR